MPSRSEEIDRFLAEAGWHDADRSPIAMDASTRNYERLRVGERVAILMNAPPGAEAAVCPAGADAGKRKSLGYNAIARLAGPNLNAFTELSAMLRQIGLHAPEVYAANSETGLALIEDLGSDLYATRISDSETEKLLYSEAVKALVHLHTTDLRWPSNKSYSVLEYDQVALQGEVDLLTEWYWPFCKGGTAQSEVEEEYRVAWQSVFSLLGASEVFVLRDYHAENLLWLADQKGIRRVGIIDFQDGLIGHHPYDLVSLLEDARRDVAPELAREMVDLYLTRMLKIRPEFDVDQFHTDYAILAAQRNAKILGIFARLITRDGKEKYRSFLPRVAHHFARDISRPALRPLNEWARRYFPELLRP